MKDLSDDRINVKTSTIIKWEKEFLKYGKENQERTVRDQRRQGSTDVDETSVKVNTDLHWIHTISNERGIFIQ